MILDPTILACCDRCGVTEEIAMQAGVGSGQWAVPGIAIRLMELGWISVGANIFCDECAAPAIDEVRADD